MVQVPAARMVTVVPLTVQTGSVRPVKATARPELAVAATVKGESPKLKGPTAGKLMAWSARLMVWVWVAAVRLVADAVSRWVPSPRASALYLKEALLPPVLMTRLVIGTPEQVASALL